MSEQGVSDCYVPGISQTPTDRCSLIWDGDGILTEIRRGGLRGLFDGRDKTLIPALVDPHFHGLGRLNVMTSADLPSLPGALDRQGVGAFCASSIAISPAELHTWVASLAAAYPRLSQSSGATCLGAHIEGTFISRDCAGAHNPDHIYGADLELLGQVLAHADHSIVRMLTVSPEQDVAPAFVTAAVDAGIRVALGHTAASFERLEGAVSAGATCVTHMMNAMPPISARDPGLLGLAMKHGLYAELIPNPEMVNPLSLQLVVRALGTDRVIAVSDALSEHTFQDAELDATALSFKRGERLLGGTVPLPVLLPHLRIALEGSLDALIRLTSQNALAYLGQPATWPPVVGMPVRVLTLDAGWNATSVPYMTGGGQDEHNL